MESPTSQTTFLHPSFNLAKWYSRISSRRRQQKQHPNKTPWAINRPLLRLPQLPMRLLLLPRLTPIWECPDIHNSHIHIRIPIHMHTPTIPFHIHMAIHRLRYLTRQLKNLSSSQLTSPHLCSRSGWSIATRESAEGTVTPSHSFCRLMKNKALSACWISIGWMSSKSSNFPTSVRKFDPSNMALPPVFTIMLKKMLDGLFSRC